MARGELSEYRFLETLVTLEPVGLVWLFIAAVPEAFNKVPEAMVCYYRLATYCLLVDEFTN